MKRNVLFLSILVVGMIGLVSLYTNNQQTAHADEQAANGDWQAAVEVSTGAIRARRPSVAAAPNNKTVLVVYSATSSGGGGIFDINYSFSNNFGEISPNSWTKHREVYPASAAESNYVDATFDQTNRAHVVWVEGSGLAYANSSNLGSGFGNYKFFTKLSTNSVAYNPKVVTYGNNVHIIWSEGGDFSGTPEEVGPNIYHVQYYKNNLNVWGWSDITAVTYNTVQSEKPAFAVDPAGNLHVVYQQQVDASHYNILYAKGTFNGSTITWEPESNHAVITSNIPAGAYTMVEPSILYSNGRLEVSATQVFDAPNPKEAASYIYYITCDTSCNESNNWDATRISEANGGLTSALYVDITPSNIVSSIVRLGSCTSIVFDGKVTSTQDDKEQIFDSSSCNGWGDGRTELTENDESRTIQPVATTQYGWWMYVVYEEFVNLDSSEKIYFMRNIPSVYLPMISKPK